MGKGLRQNGELEGHGGKHRQEKLMVDISERNFEQVIEATLLAGGPDAFSGGEGVVGEICPYAVVDF
jgi:hypothetical protein